MAFRAVAANRAALNSEEAECFPWTALSHYFARHCLLESGTKDDGYICAIRYLINVSNSFGVN
jgi:hypothetical protein